MSIRVNTEWQPGETITSVNQGGLPGYWEEQSECFQNAQKHFKFSEGYLASGGYCDGEFAFIRRCSGQEHDKCSALQGYIRHQFSRPKRLIQDIHTANQGSLHAWAEFLCSTAMFL